MPIIRQEGPSARDRFACRALLTYIWRGREGTPSLNGKRSLPLEGNLREYWGMKTGDELHLASVNPANVYTGCHHI